MFKSNDQKPHEVISARNTKCCEIKWRESKRGKINSTLTHGGVAVVSRKSGPYTLVLFMSARAANDSAFWSGFCSGGNRDFT